MSIKVYQFTVLVISFSLLITSCTSQLNPAGYIGGACGGADGKYCIEGICIDGQCVDSGNSDGDLLETDFDKDDDIIDKNDFDMDLFDQSDSAEQDSVEKDIIPPVDGDTTETGCLTDKYEPDDNNHTAATYIGSSSIRGHSICPEGESDWFSFVVSSSPKEVTIETFDPNDIWKDDTEIRLYNSKGEVVAYDDNSHDRGNYSSIKQALLPDKYYLQVKGKGSNKAIDEYGVNIYRSDIVIDGDWEFDFPEVDKSDSDTTANCNDDKNEPNNTEAKATPIPFNTDVINNSISPVKDVDYYSFTLTEPSQIEVFTFDPQQRNTDDTEMWLIYPGGSTSYNDDGGNDRYSRLAKTLDSGKYFVQIQDLGSDDTICNYAIRLNVFPASYDGDEEVEVAIDGDEEFPELDEPDYDIVETTDLQEQEEEEVCSIDSFENDDKATGTPTVLQHNTEQKNHTICPLGDNDYWIFTLAENSHVSINTFDPSGASSDDTEMWLIDSSGSAIEFDDNSHTENYSSIIKVLSAGSYYIRVREKGNNDYIDQYGIKLDVYPIFADGDAAENDSQEGETPDDAVWKDPNTGLEWQKYPNSVLMNWDDAVLYCQDLILEGEDWRLPSITELRTLVVNCTTIKHDGACRIKQECSACGVGSDKVCLDYTSCYVESQCVCPSNANLTGKYLNSALGGARYYYWSFSERSDVDDYAWGLDYGCGGVYGDDVSKKVFVRCVRGGYGK